MTVEIPEFRLPVSKPEQYPDSGRVRLRGECTSVYALARANAEGWIRGRKYDPNGPYRMVFIEWDENHWTYNGQGNMWTFEDHFEPIEENKVSEENSETIRLLKVIAGKLGADEEGTPPEGQLEAVPDGEFPVDTDQQYTDTLKNAVAAARKGEAFILVTVGREMAPEGREILLPQIFKGDKSEDASLLVGVHVNQIGAMLHQELAVERIQEIIETRDPEPPDLVA